MRDVTPPRPLFPKEGVNKFPLLYTRGGLGGVRERMKVIAERRIKKCSLLC